MTSHDEIRDNLPAYVLGGLEPEEARAVGEHLRGCDACRKDLASYETAIYALDLSAPDAPLPEGSRDRLMDRAKPIGESPGSPERAPTAEERPTNTEPRRARRRSRQQPWRQPRRPSRVPWMVAAASLLVAVFLGGGLLQQSRQVAQQQDTISSVVDLMERADLEVQDVPTPESEARVRVYEAREGDVGMVVFDQLPSPPEGTEYQLWMGSGGERESEGTFALTNTKRGSYHKLLSPPEGFDEYDYVGVLAAPEGGVEDPPPTSDSSWVVQSKL